MLLRGALASLLSRLAPAPSPAAAPGLAPVFIVGFWRSGTTLLHELLSLDPRVAFPRSYDCMAPAHAHWTGAHAVPFGATRFESRRAMDNMVIRVDSPQEDEFFLLNAGARSFYELFLLPEEGARHLLALDPATWEPCDRERWLQTMEQLLGNLAATGRERAVLKSPTHAFRVPLLAERFPEARFIHIGRDPVDVFLSTRHTWRANARLFALHGPSAERDLDGLILRTLRLHRECIAEARQHLGPRWHDLEYADLARDPLAAVAAIYQRFQWPGFETVEPALLAYGEAHADFRPNAFPPVDPAERARILAALG
jgi:hypothetical protein